MQTSAKSIMHISIVKLIITKMILITKLMRSDIGISTVTRSCYVIKLVAVVQLLSRGRCLSYYLSLLYYVTFIGFV